MLRKYPIYARCALALGFLVVLPGCDSNSGGASDPSIDTPSGFVFPIFPTTEESAARLLAQSTFGTTREDIARVESLGINGWVEDQFTKTSGAHLAHLLDNNGSTSNAEGRISKWWEDAIDGEHQLRGRVAFALSQIFVVSDVQQTLGNAQLGLAHYYDILSEHAFGNYRDLLEDVTLSPVMGVYLSMMQNAQADPATNTRADENFAREVMQLFSIGLHELNIDGTLKLSDGEPIPTYTQADVGEYARVFTGWGYGDTDRWNASPASQYANFLIPMEAFPEYHDSAEKRLLNDVVVPAGQTAEQDLKIALDSLFEHPNVGPFIAKQLIQRLVTSNPTPAYVARVARWFTNNGTGVRGDLEAVVRAILLDNEARYGHETIENFGKIREPVLRLSHLWRAFDAQFGEGLNTYSTNAPQLKDISSTFGQNVLGAASVFNFFHPDYAPQGALREVGLTAPEAEIYTENYVLATNGFINTFIHKFYTAGDSGSGAQFLTHINISDQANLAADTDALLDELDLVLMSGQMRSDMRIVLKNHLDALPDTPEGRAQRALDGISLIMASPAYLIQK